ncbi:NAD(P)-dependent dehydrogenase, short-chain alcohol dehydrogenase family [Streptoalloteichus tenebrarius]|uniref:NAD(P)-dependent dehydrogenase, short-chain alcohol dehydrogenase family n=1 Tax=Streptoalloteichus tenebrarius (strain ATCC 17920 / DSM 40477 / JCM 4838 / CBS 697.72 / NBRC 16177 / NCIMB 11028 / NRRL B-12390 / A12253. 1 / ISP 5477) TaxID=1933 RepID=A0ABT1HX10_STRSD|nr:3-oxoacyl-ACP reductase family protein [Streptoalloteichus tenebrarius]MCP2260049.1 NAD(P)-dependent dehydrogenase, short-chain alcohol dehydrogenase family [Streptoalloteichus tenebrarius]BFF03830.1 SDR family oxidoreductase [Streptoalloteichus tenebrarius]
MSNLMGKVALVTGGSRGIGAVVAERLAREGADVVVTYVRSADQAETVVKGIRALGRRGLAVQADAADSEAVVNAVERAVAEFGRLDILVNNAGVGVMGPLDEITVEQIDLSLAVNVRSVFVASQAAARHMGPGGRIVSIGSALSRHTPFPGATPYALSKSALVGLTKGLARDLADRGVTVNLVQPGAIDTDLNPADGPAAEAQRALTAVGHFGEPSDIAAMISYLVGEEARYVTGTALAIDGGHSI